MRWRRISAISKEYFLSALAANEIGEQNDILYPLRWEENNHYYSRVQWLAREWRVTKWCHSASEVSIRSNAEHQYDRLSIIRETGYTRRKTQTFVFSLAARVGNEREDKANQTNKTTSWSAVMGQVILSRVLIRLAMRPTPLQQCHGKQLIRPIPPDHLFSCLRREWFDFTQDGIFHSSNREDFICLRPMRKRQAHDLIQC